MLVGLLLLALGLVSYLLARIGAHIIFRPQKKRWPLKLPFQTVEAGPLTGVYLPAKSQRPTFLFFHGRGGNVSHFEHFATTYAPYGYGILMFDYRGFGSSTGRPSQCHLEQDAQQALTYALQRIPAQDLVLFGHSLGNAAALFAATASKQAPVKALILQSPFLSTPDMAASWATHGYQPRTWKYRLIRALVTPFLSLNRFDNTHLAKQVTLPVLLCMSKQDATLPWQQSAKLADTIPTVQRFLSATGGHDEFNWAAPAVDKFLNNL